MQKEKTYASMRPKIQNCKILIEQICLEALKYDNTPFFPDKDILPTDCRSIRFPALRFPLFWPTLAKDPRNKPEEGFPNGRFPIGDRLVISLMRKGLSPEEVFDAYINTDYAAYSNLDRAMELTEHQLKLLDKECDVSFSRELMDRFRKEHIFIDNIHPSESILERILLKILSCTDFNLDTVQENGMSIREHVSYFIFKGTLSGRIQQPIHPAIGRHFNIPWLTEEKLYLFPPFGKITFRQYLKEYINYSPIL
jgi:hypothetical protein